MVVKNSFNWTYALLKYFFKGYSKKEEQGARFSSKKELAEIFKSSNKGVLINGKDKRLSEKDSYEHIAVIAKPGSGKSTVFVTPAVLEKAKSNCSIIVTDPSGEIFQNTSGYMKQHGYNVLVLNPDDIRHSNRFNPFYGLDARDVIEIEQICTSIILSKYGNDKEGVWNDGAISLLELLAKCLAYREPDKLNLANLTYLVNMFGDNGSMLDDWVAEHSVNPYDINDRSILNGWLGLSRSNKNMMASYATIAKTALKLFNNREIQKLVAGNDIDFDSFRKQKTILYLIFPAQSQSYYQSIIDVLYSRFFSQSMKRLVTKQDLSIYLFMDEFGSSYINEFQAIINNVRKYRISISIVLQSLSQLDNKYGKSADAIKGGIGSYLIFAGVDYSTGKEISDVIGKRIIVEKRKGYEEESYREMTLLSPDQIRTLKSNNAVFVSKNRHPVILETVPFYEHSSFKSYVKKQPYQMPENRKLDDIKLINI